jgi:hypothetical protein
MTVLGVFDCKWVQAEFSLHRQKLSVVGIFERYPRQNGHDAHQGTYIIYRNSGELATIL